ncbi:MAG: Na(+)-translocating NADH-quinone reductase subunit C [Gammaproteobacteria bacterium]|nr:Na(+)-translocating NADH-quinone reductase subunit C [Gammaproteobacteria bacterium]NNF49881.1 Na(+)-translocating NADH-quinone reductase subunit C [Woeseiaceae bacterium]MBT8094264.1 Na(+)-translocating NADH-quinone reductase subunit C [Gammaproteobacteria bacterium]MBT8104497.1 Na(+)-translocating NADH-quinone reductase subunit C [Gammaproteobacteria bacterium]NNK24511.1 Na(+)-translocating NADH-quinone reductase subunit C [Woeseiaceae bacterium]
MSEKKPFDRDSISNTLIVAIGLSLVCSIIVSSAAIVLKPVQRKNEELFRQQIILDVAGLMQPGADVGALFETIETRVVDLDTGDYSDDGDTALEVPIPPDLDIASIGQRPRYVPIYLVREGDAVTQVILPVYGKGLWSTMLGYLSVAPNGDTIRGLRFYAHAETPGLGDQIDKDTWRAQWAGKLIYGDSEEPQVRVVKGKAPADSRHEIDGLAGATLTANGVTYLVRYWTGPHGFGPYLEGLREESQT